MLLDNVHIIRFFYIEWLFPLSIPFKLNSTAGEELFSSKSEKYSSLVITH